MRSLGFLSATNSPGYLQGMIRTVTSRSGVAVELARNTVTTWHYDSNSLYWTSEVVNSNGNLGTRSRTTTYSFDFNTGLKTAERDADNNNVSTTYSYDWLGRETLRTEASAPDADQL